MMEVRGEEVVFLRFDPGVFCFKQFEYSSQKRQCIDW